MGRSPVVAGVDGWSGGWVAVTLVDGVVTSVTAVASIADLDIPDAVTIGIDMPIGLPGDGVRACDEQARRLLGRRGASVFPAPPRQVLEAPTYAAARELAVATFGRSVSAQSYALRSKIIELDAVASRDGRFREVHPELAFMQMLGSALPESKKTWSGHRMRLRLLEAEALVMPDVVDASATTVPIDDVVDAVAAAWSAARIAAGTASRVPDDGGKGPFIWW